MERPRQVPGAEGGTPTWGSGGSPSVGGAGTRTPRRWIHRLRAAMLAALVVVLVCAPLAARGTVVVHADQPCDQNCGGGGSGCSGQTSQIGFVTEPPTLSAPGTSFSFDVEFQDTTGCLAALSAVPISVAITSGTGTAGAALSCVTNPVTSNIAGRASFSCSVDKAGSGYTITASGDTFTGTSTAFDIGSAINVAVSGSQPYGGTAAFTSTNDAPSSVTVSGTLTCTTVDGGTAINTALAAGNHTVDGGSCSGLSSSSSGYIIAYGGVANGFVVTPATITVDVSGSQIKGGSPSFTETDNAPSGVTLSGTLACSSVDSGTTITPTLALGNHTVDGSSCSGLSPSSTNYTVQYSGVVNGFVVNAPPTITVNVSGTQTYGGSPNFSESDNAPSGVTLSGSVTCSSVVGGSSISPTLTAGAHTIDGSTCSGLSATGYTVQYAGVTSGFVVSPATILVNVSGTQTYNGSPSFTETDTAPSGVTLVGILKCTTVDSGTSIAPPLAAGTHTVDGAGCSGLTPSDATDYTVLYAGVINGFVVSPATIVVNVSGSQTFGGSASFTQTNNAPGGVTVSGTMACTTVDSGTAINASLGGGLHTVDGTSCSGLTPSDATDYVLSYSGVTNGYVVSRAATSVLYNTPQLILVGSAFAPSATLSSAVSQCVTGQPVSFSLDYNPTTGVAGAYPLGSGNASSAGLATTPSIATSGWLEGVYTITASFAGTMSCAPSSYADTLAVATAGDAASGGGWYTLPGAGRVNFGFTVHRVPNTTCTYTGQLVLINNGKWRLKGTLTAYGKTGTSTLTGTYAGSSSGTGALFWWNTQLNGGLGGWQQTAASVSFLASFSASSTGKKTSPGSFGIQITYLPVSPQPASLPNSPPQQLKGGSIRVS